MNFAWARIAVRLIGLLVTALAVPGLFRTAGVITLQFGNTGWPRDTWTTVGMWAEPIGALLQLAIGQLLLFGPQPVLRWCLKDVGTACTRCGYEISDSMTTCPECGLPLKPVSTSAAVPNSGAPAG